LNDAFDTVGQEPPTVHDEPLKIKKTIFECCPTQIWYGAFFVPSGSGCPNSVPLSHFCLSGGTVAYSKIEWFIEI